MGKAYLSFTVNAETGALSGDLSGNGKSVTKKGVPTASNLAVEITLSVRVVEFTAACSGSAALDACHKPGEQVCAPHNETSRDIITAASTQQLSLLLAACMFAFAQTQ